MCEVDPNGKPVVSSSGKFMGWNTIYRLETGDRYMTRFWFGRLRLHIFHRGDEDPDPHDHPWDFWTFPLTPYVEEVANPQIAEPLQNTRKVGSGWSDTLIKHVQVVQAFRWNFRPATHTHRVLGAWNGQRTGPGPDGMFPAVKPGKKIVTIIWRSAEYRKWGFLKNRDSKWCWIGWRDYVVGGGKNAPCE